MLAGYPHFTHACSLGMRAHCARRAWNQRYWKLTSLILSFERVSNGTNIRVHLAAVETVEVRCRVTGFLDKIDFKAGQIVKKGDLLFTIDRRPFQAELDRANAGCAARKAEMEHAEVRSPSR